MALAGGPPINLLSDPHFGGAGRALMEAMQAHQQLQHESAAYQHPPSHPPAHMVGRPGETGGAAAPAQLAGGRGQNLTRQGLTFARMARRDPAVERQRRVSQRMGAAFGPYPGLAGSRTLVRS